jgi:putative nucleotidyltransferase with HDIG domain
MRSLLGLLGARRGMGVSSPEAAARGAPSPPPGGRWPGRAVRLCIALLPPAAVAVLHLLLFPPSPITQAYDLEVGAVADEDLRAPFTFYGPRPQRELEAARRQAAAGVEPVYRAIPGANAQLRRRVAELVEQSRDASTRGDLAVPERASLLTRRVARVLAPDAVSFVDPTRGEALRRATQELADAIIGGGIADLLPSGSYTSVRVIEPGSGAEIARPLDALVSSDHLRDRAAALARGGLEPAEATALARTLGLLLSANLSYDDEATEVRRRAGAADVVEDRAYARGELILRAGSHVTLDHRRLLDALEEELARRAAAVGGRLRVRLLAGRALQVLIVMGGLLHLAARAERRNLVSARASLLMSSLLGLFLCLASLVVARPGLSPVAVPIALPAMLGTVLLGEGNGLRVALAGILLLAVAAAAPAPMAVVWVAIAVAAVRSIRRVRHRNQFYKSMAVVSVTSAAAVTALALSSGSADLGREIALGAIGAFASAVLALFLLPMFEALFGATTDLTLLELSDLNHPLMRRMALESPGTFHHSQVVGQLAEAGAHAIGANSLMARVGASYHDIGKMLKPRYYVENQSGENVHDDLTPSMSAMVIAAHVRDGVELGRQWGLPATVTDFIPEHHGTTVMQYFYQKALERDDGGAVSVDDFRYPGPRPRCRETAIVMLADGVEAATRSLRRPTPSRIREMTRKVFERRMAEGELDECGLTLADLAKVREAFIPILVSIHHERVAYPGQSAHEDQKEQEGLDARARARRKGAGLAPGA